MCTLAIVILLSIFANRFLQKKTSTDPRRYDVFLSFRGEDTRTCFTDILYNSLVAAGLHVFKDNIALPDGEAIGPNIIHAIRSCRISIPIISPQYAQSEWCLRELAEIMDCHEKHHLLVFPVFYRVDVVDQSLLLVRVKTGLHGGGHRSLKQHQMWQSALASVKQIRGWISQKVADGELVKMVVAKVSSELKATWIERLPMFPILMSNYHIRSVYFHFLEKKRREVFLSFRGSTGNSFAACLYTSLVNAGIGVFSFEDPALIGTHVAQEIHNAIDHCKISIPILCEKYASSACCLDELAQMVECKNTRGQKMLPIFYRVRPSHVRDVSHFFRKDMVRQKKRVDKIKYERWEQSLREVGSSQGWESEKIANGHEGELVKLVVKEVLRLLIYPPTRGPPSPSIE